MITMLVAQDTPRRLDAVHVRHLDIHEHHIRRQRPGLGDRLCVGGCLPGNLGQSPLRR
jgi:hypothetical protein